MSITKVTSIAFIFLVIFLTGFWLHRSGKPYSVIFFNLHKLIALGTVAYLAVNAYRIHQAVPFGNVEVAAIVVTGLLFVITILSGGLANLEKPVPETFLKLHQIAPYLSVLSSAWTLYLLMAAANKLSITLK